MNKHSPLLIVLVAIFVLTIISGCTPVEPWQKKHIASPSMQFDPDPLLAQTRRHLYESKEGSAGGYAVGVGGCGCN